LGRGKEKSEKNNSVFVVFFKEKIMSNEESTSAWKYGEPWYFDYGQFISTEPVTESTANKLHLSADSVQHPYYLVHVSSALHHPRNIGRANLRRLAKQAACTPGLTISDTDYLVSVSRFLDIGAGFDATRLVSAVDKIWRDGVSVVETEHIDRHSWFKLTDDLDLLEIEGMEDIEEEAPKERTPVSETSEFEDATASDFFGTSSRSKEEK
jgi:hypothetical protein